MLLICPRRSLKTVLKKSIRKCSETLPSSQHHSQIDPITALALDAYEHFASDNFTWRDLTGKTSFARAKTFFSVAHKTYRRCTLS